MTNIDYRALVDAEMAGTGAGPISDSELLLLVPKMTTWNPATSAAMIRQLRREKRSKAARESALIPQSAREV